MDRPAARSFAWIAVAFGCAFAALAGLVAAGTLTRPDEYVVRHWMPVLAPADAARGATLAGALIPGYGLDHPTALEIAGTVVTLPGYILVGSALFLGGLWLLLRRGLRVEAALWGGVFLAGNIVEVVTKDVLARPALYGRSPHGLAHFTGFDSSYPSGHALRICLVAALVVRLWPRLWPAAAVCVAAALVLLVASGAHTVSDVAGGVLLAGFLVAVLAAARRGRAPAAAG